MITNIASLINIIQTQIWSGFRKCFEESNTGSWFCLGGASKSRPKSSWFSSANLQKKSTIDWAVQKQPAGAGMERVGVSNSLLGTFEQHWDLPVILSLAMMKNV